MAQTTAAPQEHHRARALPLRTKRRAGARPTEPEHRAKGLGAASLVGEGTLSRSAMNTHAFFFAPRTLCYLRALPR